MNISIKTQVLALSAFFVVAIAGLSSGLMWYGQSQIQALQSDIEVKDAQLIIESNRVASVQNLYNQQLPFTRNQGLKSALAHHQVKGAQKTLATNFKRLKASGVVSAVAAYDAQGKPLVNLPDGHALQVEGLVRKVLQQQKILSDFISDAKGYPMIALSFPLYYERGRPAGVIVLAKKPDYFLSKLAAGHEKGVGFILRNRSGQVISQFGEVPKGLGNQVSHMSFKTQKHKSQVVLETGTYALIELPLMTSQQQYIGSIIISRDVSEMHTIQMKEWGYTLVAILIFIALAMAILYWRTTQAFAPLNRVETAVKRMAEGDLSTRFEAQTNNEIGHLIYALERMREGLNTLTREIQSQSNVLIEASSQTVQDSDQISAVLEKTRSVLSSVMGHVEKVTQLASKISAKTEAATEKAQLASRVAHEGQTVLNEAATALQRLGEQVHHASDVVDHLQKDSQNIENILVVIKEIAEQTNLLALNAAIEAARAGEHGRGFAVVADEVRGLAGRTQTSISEIEDMISRLLKGTGDAVQAMETAQVQSQETSHKTSEVEQHLTQIVDSVGSVSDQNHEIVEMASRQQEEVKQVTRFTQTITEETEKAVNLSQQGKTRAHALAQVAQKLRSLIQHFKL